MRCVLYLRMSRETQDKSIGDQRTALYEFANKNGYVIVAEYVDEGISGDATEKRLQFQRMIKDCGKKTFDLVLCWDQDRFGRFDPLEAGYWIKPMRDAGVQLETIAQGRINWDDFAGRIVWSVSQEAKHSYLRDLARNVVRGNIARAKAGKFSGRTPFGYRTENDKLVLGPPEEVAIIRHVFELRSLRLGYRLIAQRLNDESVPVPGGARWSHNGVKSILDRELYTGTLVYGRRKKGKYSTVAGAESGPIKVENSHPAIIDRETWRVACELRDTPVKRHATKTAPGAPLAGLLRCGLCGGPLYAQNYRYADGRKYPSYVCAEYLLSQACGCCRVPQGIIHDRVSQMIKVDLLGGSLEAIKSCLKDLSKHNEGSADQSKIMERRVEVLDRQIDRAMSRLLEVDSSLVPELQVKILEMKQERERLRQTVVPEQQPECSIDEIAARLWELGSVIETVNPIRTRAILTPVIDHVRVDFRKGEANKRGQSYVFSGCEIFLKESSEAFAQIAVDKT
jgi:site-specific DNA recombinase